MVQSAASAPPAKMISCRPNMISSQAASMQCAEVAQAELIEKEAPLILNGVARQAEVVELIVLVTA